MAELFDTAQEIAEKLKTLGDGESVTVEVSRELYDEGVFSMFLPTVLREIGLLEKDVKLNVVFDIALQNTTPETAYPDLPEIVIAEITKLPRM